MTAPESTESPLAGGARSNWLTGLLAVILLLVSGLFGCRSQRPILGPPGTLEQQRFSATIHDPYADNDIGPEVVGGRPKDFQKPLSEPDRSRLFQKIWLPF